MAMGEVGLELTWAIHPRDFKSTTKTLAIFQSGFKCFNLLGFIGYRRPSRKKRGRNGY